METLPVVLNNVHRHILDLRAIYYQLEQPKFKILWEQSSLKEQHVVLKYIKDCNKIAVFRWITEHISNEVGEQTMGKLRHQAKNIGVPHYSRLSKGELITGILTRQEKLNG